MPPKPNKTFAQNVLKWFDTHGRKHLPWQQNKTPYSVWLSEIMLQQTQVVTAIPYYEKFLRRFPTVQALAGASQDEVLALWSGLGYYSRARNLHACAQKVVTDFAGEFPRDVATMSSLPGIGPSTAGAILSLASGIRAVICDGNVKRVLCRYYGIAYYDNVRANDLRLWQEADALTPSKRVADYNQAMMDLGAGLCSRTSPDCGACPLAANCVAHKENNFSAYPGKKPAKKIPVRQTRLLILQNTKGEVLLQQRPPTGIWGSLWVLPEIPAHLTPLEYVHDCYGTLQAARVVPGFRHTFSHFHLDISAYAGVLTRPANRIMDASMRWQALGRLSELGLPAPITKLLASLP